MKCFKNLPLLMLLLLPVAAVAQPQLIHEWSNAFNTYPTYARGNTTINLCVTDASNNFYLAGAFSNTADFDPTAAELNMTAESSGTGENIFLAKYNSAGVVTFSKRIGAGAGILSLSDLTIDNENNIYICGNIHGRGDFNPGEAPEDTLWLRGSGSTGFVAKYNSNGTLLYAFLLETQTIESTIFLGINVGSNNLLYLAGTYAGQIDINPAAASTIITTVGSNPQGVFITYDKTTGSLNNSATFSHTGSLMGVADMTLDALNNCFIVGSFGSTVTFSGSGGPVVLSSSGNTDIFMAGWNETGTLLQAKRAGGTGADRGRAILKGADGSLYISASFSGTADVNFDPAITTNLISTGADGFLSKYAPNGSLAYAFELSPADKMALVTNDTLIVSGLFKGTRDFDPSAAAVNLTSALANVNDIYTASYTPDGAYKWAFRITSTGPKYISGLIAMQANQFIVSGDYQSNLNTNPAGSTTFSSLDNKSNAFFSIYQNTNASHLFTGITGVNRTVVDMARAVATGTNGDVYTTGYFAKTIDVDPTAAVQTLASAGSTDIFFTKHNRSGQRIFAFRFGSTFSDQGKSIAVDASNNVYVAGVFNGTVNFDPLGNPAASLTAVAFQDIFISKYNSSGQWIFTKQIGGTSTDIANKILIDKDGNILVAGAFAGTTDFDPDPVITNSRTSLGNYDAFIAKYSPSGSLIFAHQIGGTGYDESFGAGTNPLGEIYMCGTFSATVDFNPSLSVTLNITVTGGSSRDAFFAKFDAAGNLLFAHGVGSTSADQANEIISDRAGNVVVAGHFFNTIDLNPDPVVSNNFVSAGSNDLFIAWYTNAGVYIRAIKTGGNGLDEPRSISYDDGNNIIVAGRFSGTADFNPDPGVTNNLTGANTDAFVAAYSNTGQYIFASKFGAFDQDDALGLAVDTITKAIYIGGQFDVTVNFSTPGRPDAFLQTDINANAFIARYSTVPLAASFIWSGAVNTAWENAANWSGNAVPNSTSAVSIPSGMPRYPVVNTSTSVKSISCSTGATVTVATGVVLTVLQ